MNYLLRIKPSAEKEMRRLPDEVLWRVHAGILRLAENPRPRASRKLAGAEGRYRLRVGDYRVLYAIDDDDATVTVFAVAHRREAYR